MRQFTLRHAACPTYLHKARSLFIAFPHFAHAHPSLHTAPLPTAVATWAHHLIPQLSPTSLRTYLRTLSFLLLLLFPNIPYIFRHQVQAVLHSAFRTKDATPFNTAPPMTPSQLHHIRATHLPHHRWLRFLWEAASESGAGPSDLLKPMTVITSVIMNDTFTRASVRLHKTARGGERPPLLLTFPPSSLAACFLRERGHPSQPRHIFHECPNTTVLRQQTRRYIPGFRLYGARNAFAEAMGQEVPTAAVSQLMNHSTVRMTKNYLRHVITHDQRRMACLLEEAGRISV